MTRRLLSGLRRHRTSALLAGALTATAGCATVARSARGPEVVLVELRAGRDTVWGPDAVVGATQPSSVPLRDPRQGVYRVARAEQVADTFRIARRADRWAWGNALLPAAGLAAAAGGRPWGLTGVALGAVGWLVDRRTGAAYRHRLVGPPARPADSAQTLGLVGTNEVTLTPSNRSPESTRVRLPEVRPTSPTGGSDLTRPNATPDAGGAPEAPLTEQGADSLRHAFVKRLEAALAPCAGVGRAIRDAEGGAPPEAAEYRFDRATEQSLASEVDSTRVRILARCSALSPFALRLLSLPTLDDVDVAAGNIASDFADAGPVFFAFGDSVGVADSTRARLAHLARRLREHPLRDYLEVTLIGAADPSGGDAYNRRLGAARARRVRTILTTSGLDGCCRVRSVGEDPAFLVTASRGRNDRDARANRRVQFLFGFRVP